MKTVKVAVIGYGHLGKWHCEKVQKCEHAELVAIVEVNSKRHDEIQELYPQSKVVSRLDEVLSDIDAGMVVTPTSYHASVVLELLKNNKHVFCEKPLCSSIEEANEIKKQYGASKELVFQVGHSERFHQIWEKFKAYCQQSKNALIQINRVSPFKGRATDVDVVQDLMIHDIDLLFFLFGSEVMEMKNHGIKNLTNNWDHVASLLELNSGNRAWINVGRNSCTEERSLRVSDSRGELFVDLMNNTFELRGNKGEVIDSGSYPKRDHLWEEHLDFYSSIQEGKEPLVGIEAGLKAVETMANVINSL